MAGIYAVRVKDGSGRTVGEVWFEAGAPVGCIRVAGSPAPSGRFTFDMDPDAPALAALLARTRDGEVLFRWLTQRVREVVTRPQILEVAPAEWATSLDPAAWKVDGDEIRSLARRLGVKDGHA